MYLLDSNIFLEFFLDQEQADKIEEFFHRHPPDILYITEFSLYSIGLILIRKKLYKVFQQFVEDEIINGGLKIIRLLSQDMGTIIKAAEKFDLDFDDAYQYAASQKHNLIIVSFDSDFDRTEQGRKTPLEILKK
ncbi:MAG: PIN domain-containing protein [Bacteroidota bacterium]|nr:PIN domain-containing protein [Bacteroidota bacterium]